METNRPPESEEQQFETWARQRMREMREEATEATKVLGLPPEAKFDVLRVLYGSRPVGQDRQTAPDPAPAPELKPES